MSPAGLGQANRSLIIAVPERWVAVPEHVAELRRYLRQEFGAVLVVTPTLQATLALEYAGAWGLARPLTTMAVRQRLDAAFVSLQWLRER